MAQNRENLGKYFFPRFFPNFFKYLCSWLMIDVIAEMFNFMNNASMSAGQGSQQHNHQMNPPCKWMFLGYEHPVVTLNFLTAILIHQNVPWLPNLYQQLNEQHMPVQSALQPAENP